jgi:hypothetical protein
MGQCGDGFDGKALHLASAFGVSQSIGHAADHVGAENTLGIFYGCGAQHFAGGEIDEGAGDRSGTQIDGQPQGLAALDWTYASIAPSPESQFAVGNQGRFFNGQDLRALVARVGNQLNLRPLGKVNAAWACEASLAGLSPPCIKFLLREGCVIRRRRFRYDALDADGAGTATAPASAVNRNAHAVLARGLDQPRTASAFDTLARGLKSDLDSRVTVEFVHALRVSAPTEG